MLSELFCGTFTASGNIVKELIERSFTSLDCVKNLVPIILMYSLMLGTLDCLDIIHIGKSNLLTN